MVLTRMHESHTRIDLVFLQHIPRIVSGGVVVNDNLDGRVRLGERGIDRFDYQVFAIIDRDKDAYEWLRTNSSAS